MARTEKQVIKATEEWLDERWIIANMEVNEEIDLADMKYYEGAIAAVEWLGYDWKRDQNGKHRLFK